MMRSMSRGLILLSRQINISLHHHTAPNGLTRECISPNYCLLPCCLLMRQLLYLLCLSFIVVLACATQHPLSQPLSSHKQFSAIGVIDVGAGPNYREYKRYLPIHSSSPLHATLYQGDTLNIRSSPAKYNSTRHHKSRFHIPRPHTKSANKISLAQSAAIPWTTKEILVPDVTDLVTVTTLAQIANNAYIEIPKTYDWIDVNGPWNLSSDFGWEKNWTSEDMSLLVKEMKLSSFL